MTSPATRCPDGTKHQPMTGRRRRSRGRSFLAVEDAIAPPAVGADNVERFRGVELRSLHWGEPFSQQGYSADLSDVLDRLVPRAQGPNLARALSHRTP